MAEDKRKSQEKITEYDALYQQFYGEENSGQLVDQAAAEILKKQSEALREQAELLDLAEDMIMVLDMRHRILFWNQGAEEKYGWSREEVLGKNIHSLLKTRFPKSLEEIEEHLVIRGRWEGELAQTQRDGSPVLVESRWALRRNDQEKPLAILEINNDITQRKYAEALLQRTLEELEARVQERTADLKKVNAELEIKTRNLEELNTALTVLLKKREDDKNELEEKVLSNVKSMVLPYVDKLKMTALDATQANYMSIMESHLNEVISSFLMKLTSTSLNLTPREIQVASLIKDGKTTKEIAELMNVCSGAVALHRNHIRKKLGLNKKKTNLRTHLLSLP
ncbi:PAS domain S-box-containing protein [Syntrophus gentianae]|uniref:PAS domain S-box-containing protein n=1 Tax=Syntrophus gentianae TaxID=43775 RepID=A0A1H7UVH3_9BACT|nr:PAS domain S-box protein [Syntrophus gentianae]SEM00972.1 PAS domain S-box-containing protein [Syntrophus gentianae]